ncbi:MAG: hypothetical protein V1875_04525 [Candidatus Altiarchaeota archaeon]
MPDDALTDTELASEGLDRESYGRMDEKDRQFVCKRIRFYRDLTDQTLVANLLDAMASDLSDRGIIMDVLAGRNARGVRVVRMLLADFKESGMNDIGDYYIRYYRGKAEKLLKGGE